MKIGIFHPSFQNYGGGEVVCFIITDTLAKSGYDLELFVGKKLDPGQREVERMLGGKIPSSVKITVRSSFTQPGDSFDLFPIIINSLSLKSRRDILIDTYSNCIFPWTDVCYIHFPFLYNYFYRPSFPYLRKGYTKYVFGLPYMVYAKKLQNYDDKLIIANSKFTASAIKEILNVNVRVLYPPVPSVSFNESPDSLMQNPRANTVVTVSRFSNDKGLEKIPYIAKLTECNARFVLIGLLHDRKVYESLTQIIKNLGMIKKVELLPNAPRAQLENTLRTAKVYLHTTVEEHFGISIAEAMAMGCIPIVHNSGGMKEFVPERYRYENLHEAARKIERALNEWTPEKAKEIIKIARQFSEPNFARNFAEMFSSYIEQHT